jgi:hypothetical protein
LRPAARNNHNFHVGRQHSRRHRPLHGNVAFFKNEFDIEFFWRVIKIANRPEQLIENRRFPEQRNKHGVGGQIPVAKRDLTRNSLSLWFDETEKSECDDRQKEQPSSNTHSQLKDASRREEPQQSHYVGQKEKQHRLCRRESFARRKQRLGLGKAMRRLMQQVAAVDETKRFMECTRTGLCNDSQSRRLCSSFCGNTACYEEFESRNCDQWNDLVAKSKSQLFRRQAAHSINEPRRRQSRQDIIGQPRYLPAGMRIFNAPDEIRCPCPIHIEPASVL